MPWLWRYQKSFDLISINSVGSNGKFNGVTIIATIWRRINFGFCEIYRWLLADVNPTEYSNFERMVTHTIHSKLTVPTKRQYLSLAWDSLSFICNLQRWRAATITTTVHWYNAYWHAHAHVARAVLHHWHFRKRIEPYRNSKFINSDGREHDDVCFYRFEQINLWRINKYVCLCIVHGGKQHAPFRASDNFIQCQSRALKRLQESEICTTHLLHDSIRRCIKV